MTPSEKSLPGLHHVTAITADAQKNVDFYWGVLGLRLVKLTVNFDDPGSYHLYYGDELGRPGTCMTFFAWQGAFKGRIGPPQVSSTSFAVPTESIDFWAHRLQEKGVESKRSERFGERMLKLDDPDGLHIELIGLSGPAGIPWSAGPVAADHAIRGFHSVTISEEGYERTARLLVDVMGFRAVGSEQNRFRYVAAGGSDNFAGTVDLLCVPDGRHGSLGAGVVHHVAFRTPTDDAQAAWRAEIADLGYNVSPVMDREYFHSIYYREPGGVLFEIATATPGFTADQPAAELGKKLMLPPWLEKHRAQIEQVVPKLSVPAV